MNLDDRLARYEAAAWFDSMLGKDVAITFEARED